MKFQGALIKEQGVEFAIVIVKLQVLQGTRASMLDAQKSFQPLFPGVPVILMAQDHNGTPEFFGRDDIVKFLSGVSIDRIPWKEFKTN